jgi:hypothetical protein
MEVLAKVLSLESDARFSRTEEVLMKAVGLKGEVTDYMLALEDDLRSVFEADSATLLFLLPDRPCAKYFLMSSCTSSTMEREDCISGITEVEMALAEFMVAIWAPAASLRSTNFCRLSNLKPVTTNFSIISFVISWLTCVM